MKTIITLMFAAMATLGTTQNVDSKAIAADCCSTSAACCEIPNCTPADCEEMGCCDMSCCK